jgi:hypothetical protein
LVGAAGSAAGCRHELAAAAACQHGRWPAGEEGGYVRLLVVDPEARGVEVHDVHPPRAVVAPFGHEPERIEFEVVHRRSVAAGHPGGFRPGRTRLVVEDGHYRHGRAIPQQG